MTHDIEGLRLRFFEIAFADRLERHARGGVESQSEAAREAVRLADAAVNAFLGDAPEPVEPDYPWHLAPEGTVGAATDKDGEAYWWGGMPLQDQTWWTAFRRPDRKGRIPDFSLPGPWRESWRWMPGKEPKV